MAARKPYFTVVPRRLFLCLIIVVVYCAAGIGVLFVYSTADSWPGRLAQLPRRRAPAIATAGDAAPVIPPTSGRRDGQEGANAGPDAAALAAEAMAEADKERKKREDSAKKTKSFLEKEPFMENPPGKPSVCPTTLSKLGRYSSWFRNRYRPNAKVFLNQEDASNYTHLKKYRLPFGVGEMNNSFFSSIVNHPNFTNPPLPTVRSESGCVRCAVVGCGGILNGSGAGSAIDSHDYVFRLNRAIGVGRHGQDVGHKTTFYMFFPESEHIPDVTDKDAIFIYAMFKMYDATYARNMLSDVDPPIVKSVKGDRKIRKPRVRPSKLKFVHPDFMRYVFATYLEGVAVRPTTGALLVVLSLHLCDEVNIFGFGYDTRFTLHYYDREFVKHTDASTALHDVDNERVLWRKLHDEGAIRLFKRDA